MRCCERLLTLLLGCLLLWGLVPALAEEAEPSGEWSSPAARMLEEEGYTLVGENTALRLYAHPQTLSVALEDVETGLTFYGTQQDEETKSNTSWKGLMQSGFAVEFYNDRSPMAERVDAFNGDPQIVFTPMEGGFDAAIEYEKSGVGLILSVRLTGDGMTATVPAQSLHESESTRISALYLYPFFGSTKLGEREGYMLIPEGSGALIDLADHNGKYKTPYQKRIYGENLGTRKESTNLFGKLAPKEPVPILSPFYGMAYTDQGLAFLAVVEEGQFNAELLAYPNGAVTEYNWVTARYIYREQYNMPTTRTKGVLASEKDAYLRDVRVRFTLLTGEAADYSGMASAYRESLTERGLLTQRDTGYRTRVDFLGGDSAQWLLFDTVAASTTVEQMRQIIEELHSREAQELLVIYKGWQKGGLTKNYGSGDVGLDGALGRFSQVEEVAALVSGQGGDFLLYQDLLLANPDRLYTTTDVAKSISQSVMYTNTFTYPYNSLYYMTPRRVEAVARQFDQAYGSQENIGVSVGTLPGVLYSYFAQSVVHSRGETAEGFATSVAGLSSGKVALEQSFDYLWPWMDALLDLPLYTSNYNFVSAEIPFLPMALHGTVPYYTEYLNFEPNNREFFLKMLEYGAYPSFILTYESPVELEQTNSSVIYSSEYGAFEEQIVDYHTQLSEILGRVEGAHMVRHTLIAPQVVQVVYDNGVEILVNYRTKPFTVEGETIEARGFLIRE